MNLLAALNVMWSKRVTILLAASLNGNQREPVFTLTTASRPANLQEGEMTMVYGLGSLTRDSTKSDIPRFAPLLSTIPNDPIRSFSGVFAQAGGAKMLMYTALVDAFSSSQHISQEKHGFMHDNPVMEDTAIRSLRLKRSGGTAE